MLYYNCKHKGHEEVDEVSISISPPIPTYGWWHVDVKI